MRSRHSHLFYVVALAATIVATVATGNAWASGFAVSDRSVSSLGSAFAGTAAVAQDASTVYNNPAAMQQLEGNYLTVALHDITAQVDYRDTGSNTTGPTTFNGGHTNPTPNLYYISELSHRARFGIGFYVPFALGMKYDDQWRGRYQSIKSALIAYNVSPSFSYQLTPAVALGAGLNAQYMTADMTTAVDFGTLCVAKLGAPTCSALGLTPQQSDGKQFLRGNGWALGYSLGLTDTLSERWRLGFVYHSATYQNLTGTSFFSGVPTAFQSTFTDSAASARLNTPQSASVSLAYAATERLDLLADFTWTGWSCHREFRIEFANTLPDSVTRYHWRDTRYYALGLSYRMTPHWLLRAGAAYDQSPVPDVWHRSVLGPDTDRRWLTAGLGYRASDRFSLDAALAYLAMSNTGVNNTDAAGHNLVGSYSLAATFVSLQASWKF